MSTPQPVSNNTVFSEDYFFNNTNSDSESSNLSNHSSANITNGEIKKLTGDFEFNDRLLLNVVGYSIMFVLGTIGNTVVCFLSHRQNISPENKGRTNVHKMVLHLTLADLIVSYIVMPLEIGWRLSVQVRYLIGDEIKRT